MTRPVALLLGVLVAVTLAAILVRARQPSGTAGPTASGTPAESAAGDDRETADAGGSPPTGVGGVAGSRDGPGFASTANGPGTAGTPAALGTSGTPDALAAAAPYDDPPFPPDAALAPLLVVPPARDPVDLARRFGRLSDEPEPTARPGSWAEGDVASWWVHDIEAQRYFQVDARVAAVTDHAYLWVQEGQSVDAEALARGGRAFSDEVVPKVRSAFGSEAVPGVDGDPRMHVLHHQNIPGIAGYFTATDLLPRAVDRYSNRHEMFYVNVTSYRPGSYAYLSLLAHEYQHMVHQAHDSDEAEWVNEGLSEVAAEVAGYGEQTGSAFLVAPDVALVHWSADTGANAGHYAAAYAFFSHLRRRFGDDVLAAVVRATGNGARGVEEALADIGRPRSFDAAFLDWTGSLLSAPPDAPGGDGAHVSPRRAEGDTIADTVEPYGTDYHDVTGWVRDGRLRASFEGGARTDLVPGAEEADGRVWWSGSGASMDSRLSRTFDLRGVRAAELSWRTVHSLETNWDYAYLSASTDGGRSWRPIATSGSSAEDPNGNNLGLGWTGGSGGWITESVDLSPFVGSSATLRFEVVTDDAVSLSGVLLDDIRLDAVGFADDASADAGWTAEGWVRVDPRLPQRWAVRVLVERAGAAESFVDGRGSDAAGSGTDAADTVANAAGTRDAVGPGLASATSDAPRSTWTWVPVGADGRASLDVAVPDDATAVVVVSAMTPATRAAASYAVRAAR